MSARDAVLESVENLPPAPDVAWRVMRIVRDPEYDADDLLRAVELDPSVTSILLKTVNSSLVGLRQPAGSLQQAIVLLGGKKIVDLVLTISAASSFTGLSGGYVLEQRGLWRHCVTVASATETLAARTRRDHGGLAFTAGLLHDLGKIVLNTHVEGAGDAFRGVADGDDLSFLAAEQDVLGTDHCEMGAVVAQKWKLPEDLVHAIRHHHQPSGAPAGTPRTLAQLVHVADATCMTMGIGLGLDGLSYDTDEQALEDLGLDEEELSLLELEILDRLDQVEEFIEL
jgi:putative nucleotidyltransferase with HDIG domain